VARATILWVVALDAIDTNMSLMILVLAFRDILCELVVTGAAALLTRHLFHAFAPFGFMMASNARFTDIFAEVYFVVEDDQAVIRVKIDGLGQWGHHKS
jgi:hypothetical protein